MFCANCGTANDGNNKFCFACGSPLQVGVTSSPGPFSDVAASTADHTPVAIPVDDQGLVCSACYRSYPVGLKFCEIDGTALAAGLAPPAGPEVAQSEPVAHSKVGQQLLENVDPTPDPRIQAEVADGVPYPAPDEQEVEALTSKGTPQSQSVGKIDPPENSPAITKAAVEGLGCPVCGLSFEPGLRFCDQDGAVLVSSSEALAAVAAAAVVAEDPEEPAWDDWGEADEWSVAEEAERKRKKLVSLLLWIGAATGLLLTGAAYAFWAGHLDGLLGPNSVSETAAESGPAAVAAPGLVGSYEAHLADQDISLVIAGNDPKPLVTAVGVITYSNVLNGGTCTASLTPISGGGVGGDTSNAVSFRQEPVAGQPACPEDIPVRMEVVRSLEGTDGIVGSVKVEWLSPSTGAILMAGTLARESN